MINEFVNEQWKIVQFEISNTNESRIEVSNYGRLRTFNKISNGNIVKGSMINGYRIIRLKFYSPREEKMQLQFEYLQQQVAKLASMLKALKEENAAEETISETNRLLESLKKSLSKKFRADLKKRTIYYQSLIHRLVAEYFVEKTKDEQTIVAHLDHDKMNNKSTNLKWMTPDENYQHQQKSPFVIQERQDRRLRRKESSRATKLTVTKVMLLKKMLNQGKTVKQLVKQFKVTGTQIVRIKKGENWSDIEAAS